MCLLKEEKTTKTFADIYGNTEQIASAFQGIIKGDSVFYQSLYLVLQHIKLNPAPLVSNYNLSCAVSYFQTSTISYVVLYKQESAWWSWQDRPVLRKGLLTCSRAEFPELRGEQHVWGRSSSSCRCSRGQGPIPGSDRVRGLRQGEAAGEAAEQSSAEVRGGAAAGQGVWPELR